MHTYRIGIAKILMCTLLLVGCTSSFTTLRGVQDSAINDLRMEIADLKHAQHAAEVEVKILEERMEDVQTSAQPDETAELKKRIAALERTIEKLNADIRSLGAQTSTYRQQISIIDSKLDEISKLRSTLSQLSKHQAPDSSNYIVKSGDSLERIARKFQISVDRLKQENQLSSDKIVVGQELAIPSK